MESRKDSRNCEACETCSRSDDAPATHNSVGTIERRIVGALLLLFEPPCPPLTPGMTAPGTTRLVPLNPGVTTAGATPGASAAALRAPGTPPLPPMPIVPRYGARNVPPTCSRTLVLRARRRPKRRDPTRGKQAQVARMTPEALQMTPLEHGGARDPRVTGEVPTEARETSDGEPLESQSAQRNYSRIRIRYSVAGETRLTRRAGPHVSLLVSVVCVCHASRVTRVDANAARYSIHVSRTFCNFFQNFYKTVRFNFRRATRPCGIANAACAGAQRPQIGGAAAARAPPVPPRGGARGRRHAAAGEQTAEKPREKPQTARAPGLTPANRFS